MTKKTAYLLINNSRFYVLVSTFLLSGVVLACTRLQIPSDQLFYIRSQQIFGLLCVLYWYAALVISPIGAVIGKQRMKHVEFARRAVGVSACYFASLHAGIALWGQLGGLSRLRYLPDLFIWSLLGGAAGLAILLVMAATSFDRVVKYMTYRRWKWLHRLVYTAGVLVVLHIWMIGTHLAYTGVQIAAFVLLVVLSGLELYRVTKKLNEKYLRFYVVEMMTMFLALWLMVSVGLLMIPKVVENYHGRHHDHKASAGQEQRQ